MGKLSVVSAPRPPCGCWRNSQPPLTVSHQGSRFNISPCRDSPSLSLTLSLCRLTSPEPPTAELGEPAFLFLLMLFWIEERVVRNALALLLSSVFLCLQCAIGPCHGRFPCRAELKHGGPGAVCRASEAT